LSFYPATDKRQKIKLLKQSLPKNKDNQNPQILDVRTPEEFNVIIRKNADNVNYFVTVLSRFEKYDKTKPFCLLRSGARSKKATAKLEELGFQNIYELEGGF
jgi:rhodanese-related sulfurtransferase